jgi:acyl-coenzyme A thioesterase PaaI-like protein
MLEALQSVLAQVAAPMVRDLGLRVVAASPGDVMLELPVTPALVHSGGVLCATMTYAYL